MNVIPAIVLGMYVVLCLIYGYLLARQRTSWQYGLYCVVLSIDFPGFGFKFMWICDAFEEVHKPKAYSELYIDEDFHADNYRILKDVDYEKEANYVSMEEALSIGSFEYRRKMIMQLLEEKDTMQYLDILQSALQNEDTETSHYASTVIMELQRIVQEDLIKIERQYEINPKEHENASAWENLLYEVLCSNLYDEFNKKRYFIKYADVSNKILEEEMPDEIFFQHKIHILLIEKNYTEVQILCERYLECYPHSEDAILCRMEGYIQARDMDGMKVFLQNLSSRPVILTQKTLQYIRIFNRKG